MIIGRLNGIYPEPGTLLGPVDRQYLAVAEVDERGCTVRHATRDDIEQALRQAPRSMAEITLRAELTAAQVARQEAELQAQHAHQELRAALQEVYR